MTTLVVEGVGERLENLRADLGVLGQQGLPGNMTHWVGGDEIPFMPSVPGHFVDVVFRIGGYTFHAHKAFFCGRSEYFQALVDDPFGEATRDESEVGAFSAVMPSGPLTCFLSFDPKSAVFEKPLRFDAAPPKPRGSPCFTSN